MNKDRSSELLMSNKQNVSNYVDEVNMQVARTGINTKFSPVVFLLSVFSAAFIMLLAIQPVFNGLMNKNSGTSANAFGFACSTVMGTGMDSRASWNQSLKDYPLPEKTGRSWTVQEALSGGLGVINYSGEGEGTFWTASKETPTGQNYKDHAAQYSEKLEAERNLGGCLGGTLMGTVANLGLMTTDLISGFAQFFATKAFDTELICPDPSRPNGSCLNLGKMIGGTGSQTGGIIGALTSSVYMPLLVIAVTVAAGWVLYIGIVKRRVREALVGTIWVLLSVIIGLAFLLNPSLLAKAPISLSNAVSTCVIGAFNGENCMTSGSTGSEINNEANSSKNVCRSAVNGASIPESMMLTTNAITCSIWKAFVLEPYAQISFGMGFEDLDTQNGAINSAVTAAGLQGNEFCVDTYSAKSYNQMKGKVLELNGGRKICNLLAYQMMLKINVKSGTATLPANGTIDDRWYKVVAVAASNDAIWDHWANPGLNHIMLSLLSVITAALGSFIIIVTSAFALVYYVSTVILMAFAPVFLLIGIHPGRGKKILFGWFEKVVSNVLKYFVSAVFLVTTLVIYGGILGSATNMGLILMFVIIITMALFLYRQELMNLLGRANMGGEQLSGALATSLGNMAQGAGNRTKSIGKGLSGATFAAAGGAVGAGFASRGVGNKERFENMWSGAKDAGKRYTSRQGGIIGNAARQYERSSVDNQKDLRMKAQDSSSRTQAYADDVAKGQESLNKANNDFTTAEKDVKRDQDAFASAKERMNDFRNAENETLDDTRTNAKLESAKRIGKLNQEIEAIERDPSLSSEEKQERIGEKEAEIARIERRENITIDFANYQGLLNEIQEAKMDLKFAESIGDEDEAARLRTLIDDKSAQRDEKYAQIGAKNVDFLSRKYNNDLQNHLTKLGIESFDNEEFDKYQDLRLKNHMADDTLEAADMEREIAKLNQEMLQAKEKREKLIYETYDSTVRDLKPGQSLQVKDLERMENELQDKLYDQNLSEDHIAGMQAKIDEMRAAQFDVNTPYLDKVDGRLSNKTDEFVDRDDLPPLNDDLNGSGTPYNGSNGGTPRGTPGSDSNPVEPPVQPSDREPRFDGDRRHRKTQENDPMPTPVDPNAGNYAEPDDRYAPPAEDEVLPADPKADLNSSPVNNSSNSGNGQGRRGIPNKRPSHRTPPPPFAPDTPMPTPVDPNEGNYAEPDGRYAPPADDEVLPKDNKNDRKEYVRPQSGNRNANENTSSPNRGTGNPTHRTPPPPFAPDTPMPTPVDPNAGNYNDSFFNDNNVPPADDEVLPKDNKNDRKSFLGDEPNLRARNEKQEEARDRFFRGANDARERNQELKDIYRPRRPRNRGNGSDSPTGNE